MHPNKGLEQRLRLPWLCGTLGNLPWRNFCRLDLQDWGRPLPWAQTPPWEWGKASR